MTRPKTGAPTKTTASLPKARSSPSPDQTDRERVEDLLDEALQATFPASDPISIGGERIQGTSRRVRPSRRR
jgi:hypothetical protein